MVLSLTVFIVTFGLLYALPWELYLVTSLYLYSLLNLFRLYHHDGNALDGGIWGIYAVMLAVQFWGGQMDLMSYTGSFFYTGLAAICIIGACIKRPFTLPPERRNDPETLARHLSMSLIMAAGYLIALYFSISLRMDPAFIYLPAAISLASIFAGIYLSQPAAEIARQVKSFFFISPSDHDKLLRAFDNLKGIYKVKDHLVVKEVISENDKELFLEVIDKTYFSTFQRMTDKGGGYADYAEFRKKLKAEYSEYEKISSSFVVFDLQRKRPVGTVRLVVLPNRKKKPIKLPLEECTAADLAVLRTTRMKIGEYGRMSIVPSGPARLSILELLLQMTMVRSVLSGLDVIINRATKDSVGLHLRLGFKRLHEPLFDDELQQHVQLFYCSIPDLLKTRFTGLGNRIRKVPGSEFFINLYLLLKKLQFKKISQTEVARMISIGKGG